MSAIKFPSSSKVHMSLMFLRRSTCALTVSMCDLQGKCRWHASVMLLCVLDRMWSDSSCILGFSKVIASSLSDTILRSAFVCFWND